MSKKKENNYCGVRAFGLWHNRKYNGWGQQ